MEECNSQLKVLNIVDHNTIRRLGWAGQIIKMPDEMVPKMVLKGKFLNTGPVGKPRKIWDNVVRMDT
jgi:hypothetical protein